MKQEHGKGKAHVCYYRSFSDDFVRTTNQDAQVPAHFRFVHDHPCYRFSSRLLYGCGFVISWVYCRFVLHLKVVDRARFPQDPRQGYFVYANHTQPFGDVVMPFLENRARRKYWIASSANLGIPLVGKLLPMWGILPIPSRPSQMRDFVEAIRRRVGEGGALYLYPEAHVWPWDTEIRPFGPVSFSFPVDFNAPVYVATTTYQRRRFGKKPKVTVFLEGPVADDKRLTRRARKQALRDEVASRMRVCAEKENTYAYVTYLPQEERRDGTAVLR